MLLARLSINPEICVSDSYHIPERTMLLVGTLLTAPTGNALFVLRSVFLARVYISLVF
jgi:hypothetical protein